MTFPTHNPPSTIHCLTITDAGRLKCLYADELLPVLQLGTVDITRASYVEPDAEGQWWADLWPVQGPTLGPFRSRGAALDAERDWLQEHVL